MAGNVGLLPGVRRLVKQALIALFFVVSASGGGHGFLHEDAHAGPLQARAAVTETTAGDPGARHRAAEAALETSHGSHDWPLPLHKHSDQACAFAHAHCCTSAILTPCHAIAAAETAVPREVRGDAVPYGRQSYPPLRPPRAPA